VLQNTAEGTPVQTTSVQVKIIRPKFTEVEDGRNLAAINGHLTAISLQKITISIN